MRLELRNETSSTLAFGKCAEVYSMVADNTNDAFSILHSSTLNISVYPTTSEY